MTARSARADEVTPEIALLTRLIAIAWLLTGHALLVPTRSVPFFAALVPLAQSPFVSWAELVIGLVCAVSLVLGRSVRRSAITLGVVIFTMTLLSRGYFSNNRLFTACVLVLAGLAPSAGPPRLLRLQVVFLYLAAGLDKLFDADWRSGVFVRSFARGLAQHGRLWSPGYDARATYAPARAFDALLEAQPRLAVLASLGTIVCELALALLFLAGRRRAAIALGLAFHVGLLVYTGSPMGMFFYSATAAYVAFVTLPTNGELDTPHRFHRTVARVLSRIDRDARVRTRPSEGWAFRIGVRTWTGWAAPLAALAHLPAFYVLVTVALAGPWFTPMSAVLLLPLLLLLPPFAPEAAEVAPVAGELDP